MIVECKQWEGRVVAGRFHLRQYLGGSTHSAVFLTESGEDAPHPVIKLVHADVDKTAAWLLRREFAAGLAHPGLLSLWEFGSCRIDDVDLVYAVMEQADDDLAQVVPVRPLTAEEARQMLAAVVESLAYVHAQGFVHGCLTPSNILAVGDRIKLSSDGLLRAGEASDNLWAPAPNGPPEGESAMTPAGDIWCLGQTLVGVLRRRPEQMDAPLREIAAGCLRLDPRLRLSLADIALALRPARPAPAPTVRPLVAEMPKPTPKKRKYIWPLAAAAVVATIVIVALLPRSGPASPPPAPVVQEAPVRAPASVSPPAPRAASEKPSAFRPSVAASPVAGEIPPAARPALSAAPAGDVVARVMPQVPAEYLQTIIGSVRVSVRVRVDRSGAVVGAELDSRPSSRYFDRVALDTARRWKFQPADGETTRVVRFEFRRDGCEIL